MIKKSVILFFIIIIVGGVFYQNRYLMNLKNQSKNMQKVELEKAIVAEGSDFKTFFYNQNGSIKGSLSSQKIVYYEDASFALEGDVKYQEYNSRLEPVTTIRTDSGFGMFEQHENQNKFFFSKDRQLNWLRLPTEVSFNFNGNRGKTKNVFIDAIKRTISSNEHINSMGPDGHISADGFFYDIDKKEFELNSSVRGTYKPPRQERK